MYRLDKNRFEYNSWAWDHYGSCFLKKISSKFLSINKVVLLFQGLILIVVKISFPPVPYLVIGTVSWISIHKNTTKKVQNQNKKIALILYCSFIYIDRNSSDWYTYLQVNQGSTYRGAKQVLS